MASVIIRPESGQEIVLGEGRSRYVGRGGVSRQDIVLPGPQGERAAAHMHRRCYQVRALADGFNVVIPGRNRLGLFIEDLASGRSDEIRSPRESGSAIGGFFNYRRCRITFDTEITGYAYPVIVEFVPDFEEEPETGSEGNANSITQGFKVPWDLDNLVHRVIIVTCAHELDHNHKPPTHLQVTAMLNVDPWTEDDTLTEHTVKRTLWARKAVTVLVDWLNDAVYVGYPEDAEELRPFAARWLVGTSNVTPALLDAVLHGGPNPTAMTPAVE